MCVCCISAAGSRDDDEESPAEKKRRLAAEKQEMKERERLTKVATTTADTVLTKLRPPHVSLGTICSDPRWGQVPSLLATPANELFSTITSHIEAAEKTKSSGDISDLGAVDISKCNQMAKEVVKIQADLRPISHGSVKMPAVCRSLFCLGNIQIVQARTTTLRRVFVVRIRRSSTRSS